jgi:hypothetical protein
MGFSDDESGTRTRFRTPGPDVPPAVLRHFPERFRGRPPWPRRKPQQLRFADFADDWPLQPQSNRPW